MLKSLLPHFLNSIVLLTLLMSQPLYSHGFHYEIQMKSELQVNTDLQISGLGMTWLYDPIVSAAMLKDGSDLKELEESIENNLERQNFFTKITSDGKELAIGKAQNFILSDMKKEDVSNLQIKFTLPFAQPLKLESIKRLELDYSDPTATAILFYEKPEDVSLGFGLQDKCKTSVKEKESFKEGEFPQIVSISCN